MMYPYFVALFLIGCLFLFLASLFLPMIVVAPRKCANLINVGSIFILASFAVIRGAYEFIVRDLLCNKNKGFFAWVYLLSILFTIWSSMIIRSYILTIISLSIEVLCLIYFICSFFPYGATGFKYMLKFVWATIKKIFECCIKDWIH